MADRQGKFFNVEYQFDVRVWRSEVRTLFEKDEATQWDIGDLLLDCETHGKLTQTEKTFFCRQAKKKWSTLKDYKSLSSQFPREPVDGSPSLRSDALSYSAYRLLGPFKDEDREKLLAWVRTCKRKSGHPITVGELDSRIRLEQGSGNLPETSGRKLKPKAVKVSLILTREDFEKSVELAAANGHSTVASFLKWMATSYWKEHKEELSAKLEPYRQKVATNLARQKVKTQAELDAMEQFTDEHPEVPSY